MYYENTNDAIFILRQLQEKYLENDKELYLVFVDLELTFDKVPRVLIESYLRRKGVLREGSDEDVSGGAVSSESGK